MCISTSTKTPQTFVMMSVEELQEREDNLRKSILNEVQSLIDAKPKKKDFLTTDEVMNEFGFSQSTLWRMEQRGELVPHRTGRKRLFALADIERVITK